MITALVLLVLLAAVMAVCALHWRLVAEELEDDNASLTRCVQRLTNRLPGVNEMPPVELTKNIDGSWTARIFSTRFTGTYEQCLTWLRANGETV